MVTGHRAGADSFPRKPPFQGPWRLPGHPRGLSSLPRHQGVCKSCRTGLSPGSLGSGADGRTSLPQGLPQASVRAPPPGSDLFLGSRCGSAAALHVVFLGQSVQVQLLSPHQALPNLRGRLMHRGTPAGHISRPGLVILTSCSASWAVSGPQKSVTSGSLAASLKSGADDITLRLIVTGTPGSLSTRRWCGSRNGLG